MKAHQDLKPSVIVQHYQFNSQQCAMSETVAEYVTAFCKLAEHCNIGDSLDEMLCDRLLCGITNAAVQKRLLTESELTFTKIVTIAQVWNLLKKAVGNFNQSGTPLKTFKFSHPTNSKKSSYKQEDDDKDKSSKANCYHCGGKHNQSTCHFKSEMCHFYNKLLITCSQWRSQKYCLGKTSEYISGQGVAPQPLTSYCKIISVELIYLSTIIILANYPMTC